LGDVLKYNRACFYKPASSDGPLLGVEYRGENAACGNALLSIQKASG
jgi:hypothetical protein